MIFKIVLGKSLSEHLGVAAKVCSVIQSTLRSKVNLRIIARNWDRSIKTTSFDVELNFRMTPVDLKIVDTS